jgi:hypothetical protein
MQREYPAEQRPGSLEGGSGPAREFWVRVAIDGTARIIRVVARSPQDALRRFPQDLHRGGRLQYSTAAGDLVVEWGNVATLEVGPIVRVVRIVQQPGEEL